MKDQATTLGIEFGSELNKRLTECEMNTKDKITIKWTRTSEQHVKSAIRTAEDKHQKEITELITKLNQADVDVLMWKDVAYDYVDVAEWFYEEVAKALNVVFVGEGKNDEGDWDRHKAWCTSALSVIVQCVSQRDEMIQAFKKNDPRPLMSMLNTAMREREEFRLLFEEAARCMH